MLRLSAFPYVLVRIGCAQCQREGAYRLARLAAKFGAEANLDTVLNSLSKDCPWRTERRWGKRGPPDKKCEACFIDLQTNRPPDLPPSGVALKVIPCGKPEAAE